MGKKLKATAVVLAVIGLFFAFCGINKKNNYENSEYSWGKHVNAYVGGDAYNYIINGTYFTGYEVIGGSFWVMGSIFYVGGAIIDEIDSLRRKSIFESSETGSPTTQSKSNENQGDAIDVSKQVYDDLPEL